MLDALVTLAPLNPDRRELMAARIARRRSRLEKWEQIRFLDPAATIPRTTITVQQARDGKFGGEDALGQTEAMSLDNQRNLKLAIHHDSIFLTRISDLNTY